MRWIGWVLAGLLLMAVFVVRDRNARAVVAEQTAVDEQLAARRAEVETIFQRVAETIPVRREQFDAETRKVAELERQLADLERQRTALEQTAKELATAADSLHKNKDEATEKREDDKDQIRELQDKITATETLVVRLRKAVARVTQKELP